MLGLNNVRSEYRTKMTWYANQGIRNGVMRYSDAGKPFYVAFDISSDSSQLDTNQGMVVKTMNIKTTAHYNFKKNDKIEYNGHNYIVSNVYIINSPVSGVDYTNTPSAREIGMTITG